MNRFRRCTLAVLHSNDKNNGPHDKHLSHFFRLRSFVILPVVRTRCERIVPSIVFLAIPSSTRTDLRQAHERTFGASFEINFFSNSERKTYGVLMECDCVLLCLIIKNDLNDWRCSSEQNIFRDSLSGRKVSCHDNQHRTPAYQFMIRNIKFFRRQLSPTPLPRFVFIDLWESERLKLFA